MAGRDGKLTFRGKPSGPVDLVVTAQPERPSGRAFADGRDLGADMVLAGMALAFVKYSRDYSDLEAAAIHPKAMPVLLLDEAAAEQWLTGSDAEALLLQRPAPVDALVLLE